MDYRPPVGIPLRSKKDWRGIVVSVAIHAVILLIIIGPLRYADFSSIETPQGAGGPGPVGGGGGGSKGIEEHINYISTAPAATVPKLPTPPVTPPVIPPLQPKPILTPPSPPQPATNNTSANSQGGVVNGSGSGTGAGPGSGGGVGSGVGTGKGTGNGPGTGGGNATSYPPTPVQFFLPPLPAPNNIKPYRLIAWFEVDEKGNARLLDFNPSKNKDYNKRLKDVLNALRFRPGVDVNGNPVKDTVNVEYLFD